MVVNRITTMGGRAGGGAGSNRGTGNGYGPTRSKKAWSAQTLETNMKMSAVSTSQKAKITSLVSKGMSGQAALQYVMTGNISSKNAISKMDKDFRKWSNGGSLF